MFCLHLSPLSCLFLRKARQAVRIGCLGLALVALGGCTNATNSNDAAGQDLRDTASEGSGSNRGRGNDTAWLLVVVQASEMDDLRVREAMQAALQRLGFANEAQIKSLSLLEEPHLGFDAKLLPAASSSFYKQQVHPSGEFSIKKDEVGCQSSLGLAFYGPIGKSVAKDLQENKSSNFSNQIVPTWRKLFTHEEATQSFGGFFWPYAVTRLATTKAYSSDGSDLSLVSAQEEFWNLLADSSVQSKDQINQLRNNRHWNSVFTLFSQRDKIPSLEYKENKMFLHGQELSAQHGKNLKNYLSARKIVSAPNTSGPNRYIRYHSACAAYLTPNPTPDVSPAHWDICSNLLAMSACFDVTGYLDCRWQEAFSTSTVTCINYCLTPTLPALPLQRDLRQRQDRPSSR